MGIIDKYNMADPETAKCPFPYYQAMREEAPVHLDPGTGFYWISRHDDVLQTALDHEAFSSASEVIMKKRFKPRAQAMWDAAGMEAIGTLVTSDPPEHDDYRTVGVRLFDFRKVEELTPKIKELCNQLIDDFIQKDEVDFSREFSARLPATIVCDEFGLPREDQPKFKDWTDAIILALNPNISEDYEVELITKWIELFRYLEKHLEHNAKEASGRVIHTLATINKKDGTPFSALERGWMATAMFVGGNETTLNMLNMGMRKLALNPAMQDEIRGDDAKIESFVEEMMRLEGSVQGLLRVARRDIVMHGVTIPKGANVVLCAGSANRDPEKWDNPDEFRLDRTECRRHLTFGHGRHACVGMQLARREMQIAFRTLLDRMRDIRLAIPEDSIDQFALPFHRGIANISLHFKPA